MVSFNCITAWRASRRDDLATTLGVQPMIESRFFGIRFERVAVWAVAVIILYGSANAAFSLGLRVRDAHATYKGIVVTKGRLNRWLWPQAFPDHYLVIRDSSGAETRRYVSTTEYLMARPGASVEKPRGLFARVRRQGQLTPYQAIDSLEALKTERDPSRRDSLLAHLRR